MNPFSNPTDPDIEEPEGELVPAAKDLVSQYLLLGRAQLDARIEVTKARTALDKLAAEQCAVENLLIQHYPSQNLVLGDELVRVPRKNDGHFVRSENITPL